MFNLFSPYYRLFIFFFISSLLFFLCLGQIPTPNFISFNHPLMAQSLSSRQWVQQGIEAYQAENYQEAINRWQKALSASSDPQERQIILENLAVVYQK